MSTQVENRVADYIIGRGLLRQGYDDSAGTNDPDLLSRDLAYGIAKILLVIESDVGNHAHQRFHDVRGVQTPAHPHFEHRNVDFFACETLERDCRHHLEKARMPGQLSLVHKAVGNAIDFAVYFCKIVVADFLPVYPDAFVDAHQVRRRIKTRLHPGRMQD